MWSTTKRKNDFGKQSSSNEQYYDLYDDWELIEASLATQYGIRMSQSGDMPWKEFTTLIAGLMPDTPLGSIVAIRAEKDQKAIKNFSPAQRKIYRDWQTRQAKKKLDNPEALAKEMDALVKSFTMMFGPKEV